LRTFPVDVSGKAPVNTQRTGEHLFITQATVETHLRHAFRKLGITSRADLSGALDP
jgi:DNA-binding CsgD family transcriptional regulator